MNVPRRSRRRRPRWVAPVVLTLGLCLIGPAPDASAQSREEEALAEAARLLGAEIQSPAGGIIPAHLISSGLGIDEISLGVRLIGPLDTPESWRTPASGNTQIREVMAPWGESVEQRWHGWENVESFSGDYDSQGNPIMMPGVPLSSSMQWSWLYPRYLVTVSMDFGFSNEAATPEQALARLVPIAEAVHRGMVAQGLTNGASAPPDRVQITVTSSTADPRTGQISVSGTVSSMSPITSASFFRAEGGTPASCHIQHDGRTFSASCDFVAGARNVFKIVFDNEAQLSAEQTLEYDASGTMTGQQTTSETGDVTAAVPPAGGEPGPGDVTAAVPPEGGEPETGGPAVVSRVPGLGGVGQVPGPRNLGEGLLGVLGPAALGLLGALMSGLLGGGQVPLVAPPTKPQSPPAKKTSRAETPTKKEEEEEKEKEEKKEPKKPRRPDKKRVERLQREGRKAQREAMMAATVGGMFQQWFSNVKQDFKEAGKTISTVTREVTKQLEKGADIAKESVKKGLRRLADDPDAAIEDIRQATKDGVRSVVKKTVEVSEKIGAAGWRAAKSVYDDPQAALDSLKKGAGSIYEAAKNFFTDPGKVWKAVKNWAGIQNFENAIDPNRSLLSRVGQVGVGVMKLYGAITTTQFVATKIKSGGTSLVQGLKKGYRQLTTRPPSKADLRRQANEWLTKFRHKKSLGGKPTDYIDVHGPPDLSGFTEKELKAFRAVADKHGIRIHVRPRDKICRDLIEQGRALPKPEAIKAKTVSSIDQHLGFPKSAEGVVACKQPMIPGRRPPGMDAKTWSKVQARGAQRAQEFRDQASKLQKLEQKGKIVWDRKSGVVYDKATGKPFTGDHDLYSFSDPRGNPVSHFVKEQAARDLQAIPNPHVPGHGAIEHPDLMSWDLDDVPNVIPRGKSRSGRDVAKGIYDGIRGKHTVEGGEGLISIGPDGGTSTTFIRIAKEP